MKKVSKAGKVGKKARETREDARQRARVEALVKEANSVLAKIDALHKLIDSDKFRDMPGVDRHIVAMMIGTLEAYAAVLSTKADWENVRLRTASGVRLNASASKFVEFLFGEPTAARFRKLAKVGVKKA
jgi:hypothetical protein